MYGMYVELISMVHNFTIHKHVNKLKNTYIFTYEKTL